MALNIKELISLADKLDASGKEKEAAEIDNLLEKIAANWDDLSEEEKSRLMDKQEWVADPSGYISGKEPRREPEAKSTMTDPKVLQEAQKEFDEFMAKLEDAGISQQEFFNLVNITGGMILEQNPETGRMETKKEFKDDTIPSPNVEPEPIEITDDDIIGEASSKVILKKLAEISDRLDNIGAIKEADLIDEIIQKHATDLERKEEADTEQSKRYDSKYHHSLQIREPKGKGERIDREGRDEHHVHTMRGGNTIGLSTRYCPEHLGVPVARIGESTYQCSMDGAIFNYEAGWTDFEGNKHPGGSVAGQTPDSSGYDSPHRIFDSRESILNRVN